jgi:hypothetical protein
MYTLQDLTMTETNIDRHVMDLKKFLQHELDITTPLDVALGDTDEFVVSEVLSHEGDPKDKRNMWFTVRWASFPGRDTTRKPWENLQNNSLLLSYL